MGSSTLTEITLRNNNVVNDRKIFFIYKYMQYEGIFILNHSKLKMMINFIVHTGSNTAAAC